MSSQNILPIERFVESMPVSVTTALSPAKPRLTALSSMVTAEHKNIKQQNYNLHMKAIRCYGFKKVKGSNESDRTLQETTKTNN